MSDVKAIAREGLEKALLDSRKAAPEWGAAARTYALSLIALRLDDQATEREDEEWRAQERVRMGGVR